MPTTSRRRFLGAAAFPAILGAAGKPRPNVLFIAIDDLNNWVGCLGGHPDTRTPNIDRLAARGVLFTQAHCAAPLCNPSRASLLTGLRPSATGVYTNAQPFRSSTLGRDAVTLPQHMRESGYRVLGAGKIFHGGFPDPPSWDEYFPSRTTTQPPDPLPPGRPLNGIPNTGHFDWGPLDVPDDAMGDYKVATWVGEQLHKKHDRPFFLGCGMFRPHLPWYVPRKYFDLFPADKVTLPNVKDDDLDDVPPIGRKFAKPDRDHKKVIQYGQWRKAVQGYLASIHFMDTCLGRVIDALDDSPYAKDTAVVLWSDHGWHLGQKLHWRKFALWEEATHNVLAMIAPGITGPGARCSRTVSLLDVGPTIMDLCGVGRVPDQDGVSLRPLLRNPQARWDRPAVTTYLRGNHSVRDERWRYIHYSDGTEELYDHRQDPLEWNNLAIKPGHEEIKRRLSRWLPATNVPDSFKQTGGAEGDD
jgi:arylsulfatase A-like enzyme